MYPDTLEEIQRMRKIPYASVIGSLMYVMLCTYPDISLVMSITSRYQANPDKEYWIAIKSILKYLRRTKNLLLVFYRGSELKVKRYINSVTTDVDDRKSTSGCIFLCSAGMVS